jgi:hypothetical protein
VKRRSFITLLGGAAAVWPLAVGAQTLRHRPLVGSLQVQSLTGSARYASGSDVQCTGCRVAVRATLPWSVYVGAPDPDTTVPILPITFEPFDRLRRQTVGEPFPGD